MVFYRAHNRWGTLALAHSLNCQEGYRHAKPRFAGLAADEPVYSVVRAVSMSPRVLLHVHVIKYILRPMLFH